MPIKWLSFPLFQCSYYIAYDQMLHDLIMFTCIILLYFMSIVHNPFAYIREVIKKASRRPLICVPLMLLLSLSQV